MKISTKIICLSFVIYAMAWQQALSQDLFTAVASGDINAAKEYIEKDPALLNSKNSNALTPLNLASEQNQVEMARMLLEMGADPSIGDRENSQPIHLAAISGSIPILEMLLKKGVNINSKDINDMTPLLFAASQGQLAMVQYLLDQGADLKSVSIYGFSALQYAAISGNLDLVKVLVNGGANIKCHTELGFTPLHSAASFGRTEVVKYLVENGADIKAETDEGDQPLALCRNLNCMDAVAYLISLGADVKHKNNSGFTALHNVAQRGTVPLAQLLLDHGADINAASNDGWVPLTYAAWAQNSVEITQFLILNGADVNPEPCKNNKSCTCGPNFHTPLHAACLWNKPEMIEALVNNGAKVNVFNNEGLTPLLLAVKSGNLESVRFLVDHGAFLNVKEKKQGCTELHFATAMGYGDISRFLVEQGSNLNTQDNCGRTPLDYAFGYGQKQIGYDLLAAGADDAAISSYAGRENLLAKQMASGEATIWFLGHSGWAIKTQNHLLIFDYFREARTRKPDDTCLMSGFIIPSELKDLDVTVFCSHDHQDHFDRSILDWERQIPGIDYVFCFNPPGVNTGYTYLPVNTEAIVGDMKIYSNKSTDVGGNFLVEVDGLVIFHMGDLANRQDELMPEFQKEIDIIAARNEDIDILFTPIRGCGLGTPAQVKTGIDYALEKLQPDLLVPMHAGGHSFEYKLFAENMKEEAPDHAVNYVINKGDWFSYSKAATTVLGKMEH